MSTRTWFILVGCMALGAGTALWWVSRPPGARPMATAATPAISGASLYATTFRDPQGESRSLGRYQGQWLVLNFWATWCAPCREEMPTFSRLQESWAGRVQFLGLSDDPAEAVSRFAEDLQLAYPLWVGGNEVGELARRLGNTRSVLPFTVLVDPAGRVAETKVGPYSEVELGSALKRVGVISSNP